MTDAHDEKEGRSGAQPPPARLPQPVAGVAAAPARPSKARDSGKPTPVRDLGTPAPRAAPLAEEPDLDEATLEVDGTVWTVRVRGRSGGSSAMKAPLLLLGFWGKQPAESLPDREALAVGRRFADLTEDDLRTALAESRDPTTASKSKGFFSEINESRRP